MNNSIKIKQKKANTLMPYLKKNLDDDKLVLSHVALEFPDFAKPANL